MESKLKGTSKPRSRLFDILAIGFLLWLFAWCLATIETPTLPPPLSGEWWGSGSFADYLTMLGGDRFYEEGFVSNYFLPNMTVGFEEFARGWYYYQVPQTVANSAIYYTHYGPVDCIINGLLRHLGITELATFYKIAAFFSVLALGFWYASASMLFNRVTAFISLLFIGTSFSFLILMDTIAFYSYEFLFIFGAVFLFLLAERRIKRALWRNVAYGGAWLLVFLQAFSSPEFIIWLQVFFIGYLWINRGRFLNGWRVMLFMASAPVFALSVHFFQVAWCLGGFDNAFTDYSAALARRTTGFELAVEAPFREFQLSQAVPFLNDTLKATARIDFIGIAILLLLNCGIYLRLRQWLSDNDRARLKAQYKLLLVFLIGAVLYFVIFIQSTVTQANLALRLLLPFLGLLIGYSIVMLIKYLASIERRWPLKAIAVVIFVIPMFPVMQFKVMNDLTPLDVSWHCQPPSYYGRTTEEVRVVTSFVRQNTSYGDIILTNIDVGDTGHPYYPHPGYEYLSQRRIEITKDIPEVISDLEEFEGIRQSLPATNPASNISFYLFVNDQGNAGQFGEFTRYIGELKVVLDTEEWWIEQEGHMPGSERKAKFYLYKIDPTQVELGYKRLLDKPPTAPVVDITPDWPRRNDDLVCSITVQSDDPDGDLLSYSYAWYKDGVLQPGLTTDTVDSSNTERGETWECSVTPNDGLLDGPSGKDQVTLMNEPPTAPVVDVTPDSPQSSSRLVCRITIESTDPDGDAISYSYAWYKDGVLQPELSTDTVNSSYTEWGETWECIVTPNDGLLDGPSGEDQTTVDIGMWIESFVKVPLESSSIEVSSFNNPHENKQSLVDGNSETYWHVKWPPQTDEHWVMIDLGAPNTIDALKVKPRLAGQFWDEDYALFQGSNDMETWTSLSALTVDKNALDNENLEWLVFPVNNGNTFRYYRLLIQDSGFLSLAELELYRNPD